MASVLLILIFIAAACEQKTPDTEASATEASQNEAAAAQVEPVATEEAPKAPRLIEAKATADDLIGVLPEGVGIEVGQPMPEIEVQNAEAVAVNLNALAAEGPILLVFYRGGWCPFCNFQIRELTLAHAQFDERGVTPVAISVDRIEEASKTQQAYTIPFPVLSDPDLIAHKGFRVINEVAEQESAKLKMMGMDLEASSGRQHSTVAIPGVFLIDKEGVVRWAHANADYRARPSIEQLLAAIDGASLAP